MRQNKHIENELEAWLTFLSSDNVEDIIELIEKFPEFQPLYETIYRICENIEGVMSMFSEELYLLDKNTAEFMVDEFSRTIEEQKVLLAEKDSTIAEKDSTIAEKDNALAEKDNALAEKDNALAEKDNAIAEKDNAIAEKDAIIAQLMQQLAEKQ